MAKRTLGVSMRSGVPAGAYTVLLQPVRCADFTDLSHPVTVTVGATSVVNFAGDPVYCYEYGGAAPTRRVVRARPPM